MESTIADFELGGHIRGRTGSILPGVAPSNVYPTADGANVLIAGNADAIFRRICEAMQQPALAEDPRYVDHEHRGTNQEELDDLIGRGLPPSSSTIWRPYWTHMRSHMGASSPLRTCCQIPSSQLEN